jgi:hypothetical protein
MGSALKLADFNQIEREINASDEKAVTNLLRIEGKRILSYCLENTENFKNTDRQGTWLMDKVVLYSPIEVVESLLDAAKTNGRVKELLNVPLVSQNTTILDLAIEILRRSDIDTKPYLELNTKQDDAAWFRDKIALDKIDREAHKRIFYH